MSELREVHPPVADQKAAAAERAIPDLLFTIDREGRILDFHAPPQRILRMPPEQFLGKRVDEFLPPATARLLQDGLKRTLAQGLQPGIVFALSFPEGERWYETFFVPPGRLGEGNGRLQAILCDITKRCQAENALAESEARFRPLFENLRDAFVRVDMAGHLLESNREYEALTGYSAAELQRLTYLDLTPERWHGFEARMVAEQVVPRGFSDIYQKEYRRKDGTLVPVELRTVLLRDPAGAPAGMWAIVRDISATKRAEEELSRSRDLLDVTQRLARIGGWEWDVARQTMHWTDETYRIHGMSAGELAAGAPEHIERSLACYDPKDRPVIEDVFRRCTTAGQSYDLEFPLNRVDGRRIWIRTMAHAVKESGRIAKVFGTIMDITERRRAEAFLRLVLDLIPAGVFWKDRDSVFLGCNQAIARAAGLAAPEQIVGKTDYDLGWKKEESDYYVAMDRWVMENDQAETHIIEPQFQANGKEVWLDTCKIPLHDEEGRVNGVLGAFLDITDHRNMEKALRDLAGELEHRVWERTAELESSRQALAQSEQKFRQMAESIREAFWLMDVRTRQVLYVSPAIETIWGRPRRDTPPDIASWLAAVHPQDRDKAARNMERAMKSGDYPVHEYRIVRPDGSIRWVEDSGWAIRDAQGSLIRLAGVVRDITEHRRLEAEILRAGEAERQRIGQDLHDGLSQSLTAIGYHAEALRVRLARESRPEAAEVRKLARFIAQTSEQAHALAQGLLLTDLSRGGLVPALQALAKFIQDLFGVDCRYEGPAQITLPNADTASQFYRIAQEAATNAAKHSGGMHVVIRLEPRRGECRLTIQDDGRGLPAGTQKKPRLGLDIMRYRANLIGAEWEIHSPRGRGTTITCRVVCPGAASS